VPFFCQKDRLECSAESLLIEAMDEPILVIFLFVRWPALVEQWLHTVGVLSAQETESIPPSQ
jgi:hypothetical protein